MWASSKPARVSAAGGVGGAAGAAGAGSFFFRLVAAGGAGLRGLVLGDFVTPLAHGVGQHQGDLRAGLGDLDLHLEGGDLVLQLADALLGGRRRARRPPGGTRLHALNQVLHAVDAQLVEARLADAQPRAGLLHPTGAGDRLQQQARPFLGGGRAGHLLHILRSRR
jgi:hypothetical protein